MGAGVPEGSLGIDRASSQLTRISVPFLPLHSLIILVQGEHRYHRPIILAGMVWVPDFIYQNLCIGDIPPSGRRRTSSTTSTPGGDF